MLVVFPRNKKPPISIGRITYLDYGILEEGELCWLFVVGARW